jgi:hypothetical protein
MGELLEWLLRKENKNICRGVGLFSIGLYFSFIFGGGLGVFEEESGIEWFREVFQVGLVLMGCVGMILTIAGFSKKEWKKDTK